MSDQVLTVDLTGLKLKPAEFSAVQNAVRSAALAEVAKLQLPGNGGGLASGFHFPKNPKLIGIWLDRINQANFDKLGINH